MFYFLDRYYWEEKDETLGCLLSRFNPNLWHDGMSADPAAWEDWNNVIKKISNNNLLTSFETLNASIKFIKFHQDEFGFELNWLINKLNTTSIESPEWLDCVTR